jgi:uncharacterized repeat protein (TIGR01451 family)
LYSFVIPILSICYSQVQIGLDIDGNVNTQFGWDISMPNKSTVGICSPASYNQKGHAQIMFWDGQNWMQKGTDIVGQFNNEQTKSVCMPNSNTIAIGAEYGGPSQTGHVRIFTWNGLQWIQKGGNVNGEVSQDRFGWSLDMPDENHFVAGGFLNDGAGGSAGFARVFQWNGVNWIQKGPDFDANGAGDGYGWSVSMPDSNTVAVSAHDASPNSYVKIFTWNGNSWIQKGTTILGPYGGGYKINMANSNTIAISLGWSNNSPGTVKVYNWNGISWIQKGSDINGLSQNYALGWDVCMPDENTICATAYNSINGNNTGFAHIYKWINQSWQEIAVIQGEHAGDFFGYSCDMPNENYVAIGAPQNNVNGTNSGHGRIFGLKGVSGSVFSDYNSNCVLDLNEVQLDGINLTVNPGNIVVTTNNSGQWYIDSLPQGNYTITVDTTGLIWVPTCQILQNFNVINSNDFTQAPDFGMASENCSSPLVTLYAPFLRRCFNNQFIYVSACNDLLATSSLLNSYVDVELDPLLTVNSASLSFLPLGNNTYQFQTGTLNPGQCVNFTLSTTVSCNATLGQTLCMNAELFPVENCALDTLPSGPNWDNIPSEGALGGLPQPCLGPWDQSSLSVDGWCQNDSIYFTVTNTGVLGGGDMECYAPVWLTVNGVVTFTDSIMLQGGQTITYAFEGNGQTWILNASQHPLHPGNSQPNAFVERCGNAANWNPGDVNDYPQDDADPVIDIYCEEVSGSYDPNDKRGYPNGVTNMNYIQPNQQLQYVIRFQNTGTDTAFTVVIRDTLDTDLNIFTVTPGVSSHSYEFRMYGPRVLEWRFDNILLPDSTTNSVGSNGFVTFHVEQNPNLAPGTVINNDADIYFDFNDPITTNTTVHRIYEGFVSVAALEEMSKQETGIKVYPNPSNGQMTILLEKSADNASYSVFDLEGKIVKTGLLSGKKTTINTDLNTGMYFLMIGENVVKVQIIQ